ncbi:MAG TPA: DUF192 domain-containing protein [Candidatus Paceibacterota bacterium]
MIKRGFTILMVVFFTLFLSVVFNKSSIPFLESSVQKVFDNTVVRVAGKEIKVELADTEEKRTKGLSGIKKLQENSGMLFIFEIPAEYHFWMKDMRFPLDIIWIGENKKIVAISENIFPETYPASFSPSEPVKYVLEVNAGWTNKNGVRVGEFIEL